MDLVKGLWLNISNFYFLKSKIIAKVTLKFVLFINLSAQIFPTYFYNKHNYAI